MKVADHVTKARRIEDTMLRKLDPDAIAQVSEDAWPIVRDVEELHDALNTMVVLRDDEAAPWSDWLAELAAVGRATLVECGVRNAECGMVGDCSLRIPHSALRTREWRHRN